MVQRPKRMNDAAAAIWMYAHRNDVGKVVARQHRQEVIARRCRKDPPQDYGGLVSGGKGHGEQLGLVSHLRQDDKPEREEKGRHIAIPPR